jgi:hypothetical protein
MCRHIFGHVFRWWPVRICLSWRTSWLEFFVVSFSLSTQLSRWFPDIHHDRLFPNPYLHNIHYYLAFHLAVCNLCSWNSSLNELSRSRGSYSMKQRIKKNTFTDLRDENNILTRLVVIHCDHGRLKLQNNISSSRIRSKMFTTDVAFITIGSDRVPLYCDFKWRY